MSYVKLKIPQHCKTSTAIDYILSFKWEKTQFETACHEYEDLLTFEHLFEREDNAKYNSLRRTINGKSIHRYTDFGDELEKKYRTSILIKLINSLYSKYVGERKIQTAMVDFKILQEVTKARTEMLKKTQSETLHVDPLASGALQQNFRQSMNPDHGGSTQPVVHTDQSLEYNGHRYFPETMYKELQNRAIIQENDVREFQKKVIENDKDIEDLRHSAQKDTVLRKQLLQKGQHLSKLLTEEREINENDRTKNQKEMTEKEKEITELRKEKARLKDETEQLKKEVNQIKNKAKTEVDKTETTGSEPSDTSIASSSNRFAQCPIVEGKWSSEKDTELLSLQEQNKSYEESMMTMLKAKRIKEDENSKLKTKVQQLERDFLKKAKEVDSLKIEKQTLEERLNKQAKE